MVYLACNTQRIDPERIPVDRHLSQHQPGARRPCQKSSLVGKTLLHSVGETEIYACRNPLLKKPGLTPCCDTTVGMRISGRYQANKVSVSENFPNANVR